MTCPWSVYRVEVEGYGAELFAARSPSHARYRAWLSDAFSDITFRRFLDLVRVVKADPPANQYEYVRDKYDLLVKHGDRIRVRGQGKEWLCGREGWALYPGGNRGNAVWVVLDGEKNHCCLHPNHVEVIS